MQQSAGRVIPLPATALMTPIRPLNFLLEMGKHYRSPLSQELTPYWSWSTLRVEGDRGSGKFECITCRPAAMLSQVCVLLVKRP
ncbi:hypothetical protein GOODEAATRI_027366 [Goodea atripinnis]|uniref:Uncharacterized protein n=1 Tax=Goodea atripinnis TaxID=208336 RepID=A0ABV0PHH3_9TELE